MLIFKAEIRVLNSENIYLEIFWKEPGDHEWERWKNKIEMCSGSGLDFINRCFEKEKEIIQECFDSPPINDDIPF